MKKFRDYFQYTNIIIILIIIFFISVLIFSIVNVVNRGNDQQLDNQKLDILDIKQDLRENRVEINNDPLINALPHYTDTFEVNHLRFNQGEDLTLVVLLYTSSAEEDFYSWFNQFSKTREVKIIFERPTELHESYEGSFL